MLYCSRWPLTSDCWVQEYEILIILAVEVRQLSGVTYTAESSPHHEIRLKSLEGTLSRIVLLLGFLSFLDLLLLISYWFPKCFLNKSLAHESFSQDLLLGDLTIIMAVSFSSYIQLYECRQRIAFNQDGRIQANNMK